MNSRCLLVASVVLIQLVSQSEAETAWDRLERERRNTRKEGIAFTDCLEELYRVGNAIERGEVSQEKGLRQIEEIRKSGESSTPKWSEYLDVHFEKTIAGLETRIADFEERKAEYRKKRKVEQRKAILTIFTLFVLAVGACILFTMSPFYFGGGTSYPSEGLTSEPLGPVSPTTSPEYGGGRLS